MLGKLFGLQGGEDVLPEFTINSVDEHNAVYVRGVDLIKPHLWLDNKIPKLTTDGSKNIRRGIHDLQAVTAYNPSNWNAFWIIGKGYQALREPELAYQNFKAARELNKENPNVAREYAESCLRLGHGTEAVIVAVAAVEASPRDAGLHANLALAYLIAGAIPYAQQAIQNSLTIQPDDKISQSVKRVIDEVAEGKRPQPKKLSDLG